MIAFVKDLFKRNPSISKIVIAGFLLRLLFTLFIAPSYFHRDNIHFDNDTNAWMTGLYNLIYNGQFTILGSNEVASYSRMPGYSLFMAPAFGIVYFFYYLQGYNVSEHSEMWYAVLKLTAYFQLILDTISIFLVYYITHKTFRNYKTAIIAALLYASYPFVIVWNPVCYSEIPSIFFTLLALALILKSNKKATLALAGACLGFAVLNRPQFALLAPLILFFFYQKFGSFSLFKKQFVQVFLFFMFFSITYGAWPLRNYIRFNKIIATQDLRGFENWNDDVIAFMQYIYAVKAEWEPQFSNILKNKEVIFPAESYTSKEDSLKLERAVYLAKNCGRGFSEWAGYWKARIAWNDTANDCSMEVAQLFNELRENQIKQHPYNFYVKVPMQNLKKAIFKSDLTDNASITRKLGGYLFYFRSLLILIGIMGLILILKQPEIRPMGLFFGLFFTMLYVYLCFGTSPQCRNIEMRYFLQADVLLLIPAAFCFSQFKFISNMVNQFFPERN